MLKVVRFAVDELQQFHRNPRRGDVSEIAKSLKARGQYRPIVVNLGSLTGRKNEILAGNHTWLAARSLGWSHIDATTVDVDDSDAASIVVADNRLADLGEYDAEDLSVVLQQIVDPVGVGYSVEEIAALVAAGSEPVLVSDADDAPAVPVLEPVTAVGQVWELGPHRLVVGSSTDAELVKRAFDGVGVADCVWTDPPYGVDYVGKTKDALRIQNDESAGPAAELTRDALSVAAGVSRPGAPVYVAHPHKWTVEFLTACVTAGVRVRQTLVWVKDRFVLGRSDYHYRHEPVLLGEVVEESERELDWSPVEYGFLPGGEGRLGRGGSNWHGDNRQSTVFEVKRPTANEKHPTMKPVELIEQMIVNSCPRGGIVYDPFAGSGSTLIAAHRQRMRAVVVELDPKYADVICERWQRHTGELPRLNGEPFDFIRHRDGGELIGCAG